MKTDIGLMKVYSPNCNFCFLLCNIMKKFIRNICLNNRIINKHRREERKKRPIRKLSGSAAVLYCILVRIVIEISLNVDERCAFIAAAAG